MKLTRYTDYSLRVLIYLGTAPDSQATIAAIAERYGISRNHVMKVVHQLGRLGYIQTSRGKHGGIRLGHAPERINIGELVRATENNFSMAECFGSDNTCPLTSACVLKGALGRALDAFLATLDEYTLADLIAPRQQLRQALNV